jgi:hypothetical protein
MTTVMELARSVQAWDDISWHTTQNTLSLVNEAKALAPWDPLVCRTNELTLDCLIGLASQANFNEASLQPIQERLQRLRRLSPLLPFISRGEVLVLDRLDQLIRPSQSPTLLDLIARAQGDVRDTELVLERLQAILYARIPANTGIPYLSNKGALIEKIRVLMARPNLASQTATETKPQPYPFFVVLGNDTTTLDDTSPWMEVVQKRFATRSEGATPEVHHIHQGTSKNPANAIQRHSGGVRSSAAKVTSGLATEAPEWGGDWYSGQDFATDFTFPMTRGVLRF